MTGFQALVIKDGNGTSQNMESYLDTNSNICGATVPTDGAGNILGLAAHPIASNLYADGTSIGLGSAVSASSLPVVIASDQAAVATISPVPSINISSAYAHTASTTGYAFGELWANNATAGSVTFGTITVAKANNQAFNIIGGTLKKSSTGNTVAIFRIHLFNAAPTTAVGDYGAFSTNVTMTNWIGSLDCTILPELGSDVGIGACVPTIGSYISDVPVSGAQTVYFAIEVRSSYTPTSAETLTLKLVTQ